MIREKKINLGPYMTQKMCLEDKIYYCKLNYNLTRIQPLRKFPHLFPLRSSKGDKIM